IVVEHFTSLIAVAVDVGGAKSVELFAEPIREAGHRVTGLATRAGDCAGDRRVSGWRAEGRASAECGIGEPAHVAAFVRVTLAIPREEAQAEAGEAADRRAERVASVARRAVRDCRATEEARRAVRAARADAQASCWARLERAHARCVGNAAELIADAESADQT